MANEKKMKPERLSSWGEERGKSSSSKERKKWFIGGGKKRGTDGGGGVTLRRERGGEVQKEKLGFAERRKESTMAREGERRGDVLGRALVLGL